MNDDIEDDEMNTFSERWERLGDTEFLEFDRIPVEDRLHPSNDLCGLLKLASLLKDPVSFRWHAEHDEITYNGIDDFVEMTDEDIVYLSRCGILYSEEFDCLESFT